MPSSPERPLLTFKDRIREKEKHNPKFSFLSTNDAYAAYYSWRLQEVKEGRGSTISAGKTGDFANPEPQKPKGPPAPPEFHFSARMPNISSQDLEIVKLTALFVAKRGKSFMTSLSQKESRNYQFDFLRPQHSLYQFFTRLVDQYADLLQVSEPNGKNTEQARLAELISNMNNKFLMLDRARKRAEWVRWQEQQKQKKEEEDEQEKIAYAQIDWHDFVVVETVVFTESDDQAELPPPTSLHDLQSASLEQKAKMSLQPHNMRIEEAMPTSDESLDYNNSYGASFEQVPQTSTYHAVDVAADHLTFNTTTSDFANEASMLSTERPDSQDRSQIAAKSAQPPMRIRSDYVPRAQARRQTTTTALCPNCNQQIPVDELEQHMRIELLDPRWKEQRAKAESRYATTNLSSTDVALNLKRLVSQRHDESPANTLSSQEEARRKRVAMAGYDGSLDALKDGQHLSVEEQIRQIHQKFKPQ